MKILIDGYNVMWTSPYLNPVARSDFGLSRSLLIRILGVYAKISGDTVVLVLDNYRSSYPYTRHVEEEGIDIVITGRDINADHWIMDEVSRESFEGDVVSSDREIVDFCRRRSIRVITAGSFEKSMMEIVGVDRELMRDLQRYRDEYNSRYRQRRLNR